MSVFDDIKSLKSHYQNRLNWYLEAIDSVESEIQDLWSDYLSVRKPTHVKTMKLLEIENSFIVLRSAIEYFRTSALLTEKRLDELDKQEYALISKGDGPVN